MNRPLNTAVTLVFVMAAAIIVMIFLAGCDHRTTPMPAVTNPSVTTLGTAP